MSRPTKPKKSGGNVVQMDPDTSAPVAVAQPEPQTPFDPPKTPPPSRKQTFWQRVAAIAKADWGTRAFIYVYCLEPICDLKRGGETKYLVKLQEPLEDENPLMIDYGSGKYRLTLVNRKPGIDKADTVDNLEIEIYNPKYPPKIPRDVWMNDQRNNRWLALMPKDVPPVPPTPLGTVTDAFDTFTKIQDSIQARTAPPTNTPSSLGQTVEILTAVKSLMPQAPASTDNTMLNTIVTLLTAQIQSSQNEAQELRKQVFELIRKEQAQPQGNTLEQMLEKADVLLPKIKGLLNMGGDKLAEVVHGRPRAWWQELLLDIGPPLMQNIAPAIPMMVGAFMRPNNQQNGQPAPQMQPQLPAGPPTGVQALQIKVGQFLGSNLKPLQSFFEQFIAGKRTDPEDPESTVDGWDFADWVREFHGEEILKDARSLGSENIMQMFRQSPYWPAIQPHEAKMREFVDQILRYEAPAEEETDGPIDLSGGGE